MIVARQGPWRAEWGGGRLADVYHAESDTPLTCVEVGEYDFGWNAEEREAARAKVGRADVGEALRAWVAEHGDTFIREALPYQRR